MNETIRAQMATVYSSDRDAQGVAYSSLIEATETPVDWAYEVWDDLLKALKHKDNHVRSIASQILCNLAKSDPDGRMLKDFDALLAVTKDERFVTARHCLLSLWKIGAEGPDHKDLVISAFANRFAECASEKNGTLIRFDIIQSLRKLYDHEDDATLREKALALIETEADPKYRKKYASVWKVK